MSRPLIGLTASNGESKDGYAITMSMRSYIAAIINAGGAPVSLSPDLPEDARKAVYARLDGILFTGGGDIAIERFNGEPHPRVYGVDAQRDALEFGLLTDVLQDEKPFFGICRGTQILNVGTGGTLYTHIEDQHLGALKHDYHPGYPFNRITHEVKVEEGSRLAEIVGEPILHVNSLHHQSIKDIASVLKPVAFAPDGLVEAVELPDHPFGIAVQWHPEWLTDQPHAQRLFKAFVEACSK